MKQFAIALLLLGSWPACAQKTLDKKFFAVSAFSAASLAADAYTTSWIRPTSTNGCSREGGEPWLLGTEPTNRRLIGVSISEFAITETATYFLKRSHNRVLHAFWPAWAMGRGAVHADGALHNWKVCK